MSAHPCQRIMDAASLKEAFPARRGGGRFLGLREVGAFMSAIRRYRRTRTASRIRAPTSAKTSFTTEIGASL